MSLGILAFLEATQTFFQTQRIMWAAVIVAISVIQLEDLLEQR
jgi:hypothetical protein